MDKLLWILMIRKEDVFFMMSNMKTRHMYWCYVWFCVVDVTEQIEMPGRRGALHSRLPGLHDYFLESCTTGRPPLPFVHGS